MPLQTTPTTVLEDVTTFSSPPQHFLSMVCPLLRHGTVMAVSRPQRPTQMGELQTTVTSIKVAHPSRSGELGASRTLMAGFLLRPIMTRLLHPMSLLIN